MLYQHKETIPAVLRDYPEWHRGRSLYGLWLVELASEELSKTVTAARDLLSPFLLASYNRQPHISLFICGFLSESARFDDDYTPEQLLLHSTVLERKTIKPFAIEVGGLNSFASAPYLEVRDPDGGIDRVRTALSCHGQEIGRSSFTPHVTVGLYSAAFPGTLVMEKIKSFQTKSVRSVVNCITFATYEAQTIAGPLKYEQHIDLRPGYLSSPL
jgi:hypothetical protein